LHVHVKRTLLGYVCAWSNGPALLGSGIVGINVCFTHSTMQIFLVGVSITVDLYDFAEYLDGVLRARVTHWLFVLSSRCMSIA
jgi:hypothetical protein